MNGVELLGVSVQLISGYFVCDVTVVFVLSFLCVSFYPFILLDYLFGLASWFFELVRSFVSSMR